MLVSVNAQRSGFIQGARFAAHSLCVAARQRWPWLLRDCFEPGGDRLDAIACEVHLLALLSAQLEGWLSNYIDRRELPSVDWPALFGADAAAAERGYNSVRAALGTVENERN